MTERLLALTLIDKERLQAKASLVLAQRQRMHRMGVSMVSDEASFTEAQVELKETQQELEQLREKYNLLLCASFPGEAALIVKTAEGERTPTVKDLRRLCDANGLQVLDKGQYVCITCGGVRTVEVCELCTLKGSLDDVGETG